MRFAYVASALFLGACVPPTEMPPPPTPARAMPAVGEGLGPNTPGKQWVVIDTPGVNARVTRVVGRQEATIAEGEVTPGKVVDVACESTPCAIELPPGSHELDFVSRAHSCRRDTLILDVPDQHIVVRHVIEKNKDTTLSNAARVLGVVGLMGTLGAVALIPIGATQEFSDHAHTLSDLGFVSLGVGVAGLVFALVFLHDREHTASATTEWRFGPPASGP